MTNDEFVNLLNDVNQYITEKYGYNVDGFEHNDDYTFIDLILTPAIGADSKNRKDKDCRTCARHKGVDYYPTPECYVINTYNWSCVNYTPVDEKE